MESKFEALEQQNQNLKGEPNQVGCPALANQNAARNEQAGYAARPPPHNVRDRPYGMRHGWNTENPANEEQEQHNVVNNGPVFNASSGADPNTKEDPGAQHQTLGNAAPFVIHRQSLEERLRAIEGRDKYSLEVVDLCLVLDVGLSADFKTP
ncbi:hypothetical protein CR513_59602, partial [Mucuna pruriens]